MRHSFAIIRAFSVVLIMMLAQGCGQSSSDEGSASNDQRGEKGRGQQSFATDREAATQSLATFAELVTEENHKAMGFDSVAEVKSATLGQPIQVMMVGLDVLRNFQRGSDPNLLLSDAHQVIFPVLADEETRSSIVVAQSEPGKWKGVSYGNPRLAIQIEQGRRAIAAATAANTPANAAPQASPNAQTSPTSSPAQPNAATQRPTPSTPATTTASPQVSPATPATNAATPDIVVHVAALGLHFIGHRVGGRLMLTTLRNSPEFNLRAGAIAPAEEVFAALAANPIVRDNNGLPM